MKIEVIVKPNTKQEKVEQIDSTHFKVWVKELPVDGKANEAVTRALARYLEIPKSSVNILRGSSGRVKTFELT